MIHFFSNLVKLLLIFFQNSLHSKNDKGLMGGGSGGGGSLVVGERWGARKQSTRKIGVVVGVADSGCERGRKCTNG